MVKSETRISCVIDGLDECSATAKDRHTFLGRLSRMFHDARVTAKLAVISRLDSSEIANQSLWVTINIQSSDVYDDIRMFVSVKLQQSKILSRHSEKDRLEQRLIESSDGMILWAKLMIEELEAGHWNVDRILNQSPRGLDAVYESILFRISSTEMAAKVQKILNIVLIARSSLRLDELAMCLALFKGLPSHEEYDQRGDPGREGKEIVHISNPLLIIMPDKTVQLAHTSLKEYLTETRNDQWNESKPAKSQFRVPEPSLHHTMASHLITYLSFRRFEEVIYQRSYHEHLLLEYSSNHLIAHVTGSQFSTDLAEALTKFFRSKQGWQWLERLRIQYGNSLPWGHLQLMQTLLRSWASLSSLNNEYRDALSNPLVTISKQRYEDSKALPSEHETRLDAMTNLAWCYVEQGYYDEAEKLQSLAMRMQKKILGLEDPRTLVVIESLARIYLQLGRWKDAEGMIESIVKRRKNPLAEEDLILMKVLAESYWYQGRLKEAEDLVLEELRACQRLFGAEHPETYMGMNNLAAIYHRQHRLNEAEELQVEVLKASRRILGAEHPDTISCIGSLASTYHTQGRLDEAEKLQIEVVKVKRRDLGTDHPSTLLETGRLANTYCDQDRLNEAEDLNVRVIELQKRRLCPEHPDTLASMNRLACVYHKQCRLSEAEELEIESLELKKRVLGTEHPDTLLSMKNLAHVWKRQDHTEKALSLLSRALALSEKIFGVDHHDTSCYRKTVAEWIRTEADKGEEKAIMDWLKDFNI